MSYSLLYVYADLTALFSALLNTVVIHKHIINKRALCAEFKHDVENGVDMMNKIKCKNK